MAAHKKALVLLSGGIDSAVVLYDALARKLDVTALTFDFAGRSGREQAAAVEVARRAGVPLLRVPLPFLAEAVDLPQTIRANAALDRAPEGYVPARNLVFYSVASFFAESLGASLILGGHHGADADRFPDASPAFFRALGDAQRLGAWSFDESPFHVELPLAAMSKRDVVRLGADLGVPFEATWSCYDVGADPCGHCFSCNERAHAFAAAGAVDPLSASVDVSARA
ncbi:MAG: 7-cyano-7-deazaguanine synthase [Thermoplasmatota archaeon]